MRITSPDPETWFTFYDGFTPEFSWWVRKPHEAADKSLEEYAKFLREEIAGLRGKDEDPLVGDPVGEAGLKRLLAGEMIAYTPQGAIAIGERELAWCEAEMRKAAREMGLGEDWKARTGQGQVRRSCPPAARTTWSPSRPGRRSASSRIAT